MFNISTSVSNIGYINIFSEKGAYKMFLILYLEFFYSIPGKSLIFAFKILLILWKT